MMPPPMPPPPPSYNGYGGPSPTMGMPYGGGPPAGYPQPQAPSSMNYVPPPSGTSAVYPSQPVNVTPHQAGDGGAHASAYPAPEGVTQPAIWYAGGKPPS